jgi:hypothetical protein
MICGWLDMQGQVGRRRPLDYSQRRLVSWDDDSPLNEMTWTKSAFRALLSVRKLSRRYFIVCCLCLCASGVICT